MIKLYSLSFILAVAGIVHLVKPEIFLPAIPSFLPYHHEIILYTGILELILALGLVIKKTQNLSAKITALYFVALLPVHIYVSITPVAMFGINSQVLLWGRTLFQFVFIFWALSLQTTGWIIEQKWKHVFFLHYKISPEMIQPLVPYKLDLYDGKAIISIVPFLMEGIRFPFLPAVPKLSQLWELNIRTYVEIDGVKGVYFFTLETDSKIGELIARSFFHLPYRHSKIHAKVTNEHYQFDHQRDDLSFHLSARILRKKKATSFELWATERYSLFTDHQGSTYQGIVDHRPWPLREVEIIEFNNRFTTLVTNQELEFITANYSRFLKVRFRPFQRLPSSSTSVVQATFNMTHPES